MTKRKKPFKDIPTSLSIAKTLGGVTLRMYYARNSRVLSNIDLLQVYKETKTYFTDDCDPTCECC